MGIDNRQDRDEELAQKRFKNNMSQIIGQMMNFFYKENERINSNPLVENYLV